MGPGGEPPVGPEPPLAVIVEIGPYRAQYENAIIAAEDVPSLNVSLDGILNDALANLHFSDEGKFLLTWEITIIKAYAADLELNWDYWSAIDQNEVGSDIVTPIGDTVTLDTSFNLTQQSLLPKKIKSSNINTYGYTPTPRTCKIDWREAVRSGVAIGIIGAIRGGITGGATGTFFVPGLGTVSGAFYGAMGGFNIGFVSGFSGSVLKDVFRCKFP